MKVNRLGNGPIVRPNMDARMGDNLNGPSLIRVPDWIPSPLGRYYLYFAHHDGRYIRLAYADDLAGPWTMHEPGVLPLERSRFRGHVASPDVHVDAERREIRMYFHGSDTVSEAGGEQCTRAATSKDGLDFQARPESLGVAYFRVIRWREWWLALGMPGIFYRSRDGLGGFEQGPTLLNPNQRHTALKLDDDTLSVYHTIIGHCPESIVLSKIDLSPDWTTWKATEPVVVLQPEQDYEGADQPLEPSRRGLVMGPVRQLRDPAIFQEGGRTYLLYSVAGEHGIAIAELVAE